MGLGGSKIKRQMRQQIDLDHVESRTYICIYVVIFVVESEKPTCSVGEEVSAKMSEINQFY
jgi:hypothetical protein